MLNTQIPGFSLKKAIFFLIICDFVYFELLQQIHYNNKSMYYITMLFEINSFYILTAFLITWVIWYGPILSICYIGLLFYKKHTNTEQSFVDDNIIPALKFYLICSRTILGIVLTLLPIDLFFFIADVNGYIFPDLVFHYSKAYHIIDIFLYFYGVTAWRAYTRHLLHETPLTGHSVYYCIILQVLPSIIFSFPFLWTDSTEMLYFIRPEYINNL